MQRTIFFVATMLLWFRWVADGQQPPAVTDTAAGVLHWREPAAEVDSLAFSQRFIDSVRAVHHVPVPSAPLRTLADNPFFAPETLVYSVGWGPFNAGHVVISTLYDPVGRVVRISGKALSNSVVGAFYRMRDHVISTVDAQGLYPLFFEQHLREGKRYRADEYFLFDQSDGKIFVQSRKKFELRETTPFTQDYMSLLYAIRALRTLAPGDTFSEQLFMHTKTHSMFFSVKASRPREVDAGTFPCVLLEPRLVGEGRAFNKQDKLEIWISDDRHRLPVVIRSKIKFGSINAKLIWRSTGTGDINTAKD
jgi:hypothetical protein